MSAGSRRREVLFVASSYPRWAADATTPFVHHLAMDLQALGWRVRVLAPHAPGARREEVLDGVPVRRFRYAWPDALESLCYEGGVLPKLRRNPARILLVPLLVVAQFLAVLRLLLRHRDTLVHSHWLLPQGFTCAIAATLLGRPHVATGHGGDVFALQGPVSRLAKRLVTRLADAVTVNSEATRKAVLAFTKDAGKVVRIPIGAGAGTESDPAAVARLRAALCAGEGPLLAFVGRLVPEKGASDLLEAVALLAPAIPGVAAVIVGDGPERDALERQAAALGIEARVRFAGWVSPAEVQAHLAAADIFVGPSRPAPDGWVEGQGLTFVEAMLVGRPVVATATGGIPDAVRHESTGLLVPPAAPAAIADAVLRLVSDPEFAHQLARAGRDLARSEFTRAVSAARFSSLYDRLEAGLEGARSKT